MGAGGPIETAIGSLVPAQGVGSSGTAVQTVFTRPGPNVVAQDNDYNSDQIENNSGVAGANVSDALDTLAAAIPAAPTKEAFFWPQTNGNEDSYRVRQIGANGSFEFSFVVPHDFSSIIALEMVAHSVSGGDLDYDCDFDYGEDGQAIDTHSGSLNAQTQLFVAGVWGLIDISPCFTELSAGDRCGINLDQNGGAAAIDHLVIRLRYN